MAGPEKGPVEGPQEEFDWKNYDYAEDREGGPRDAITNLAIESIRKKHDLSRRTFETSDMLNGGNVNTFALSEHKRTAEEARDS